MTIIDKVILKVHLEAKIMGKITNKDYAEVSKCFQNSKIASLNHCQRLLIN